VELLEIKGSESAGVPKKKAKKAKKEEL